MKPSVTFDRWISDNSAKLEQETATFKHTVAGVSFYLKILEHSRRGVSPGTAEAITEHFSKFQSAFTARGMTPPDINLPKMKIVRPGPDTRRQK